LGRQYAHLLSFSEEHVGLTAQFSIGLQLTHSVFLFKLHSLILYLPKEHVEHIEQAVCPILSLYSFEKHAMQEELPFLGEKFPTGH
jgi:hypothetical protein